MKREISHWKKTQSSRNEQLILKILNDSGSTRFNDLYAKINEVSKISQPTLSKHLKQLENEKIERYWNKEKAANCYRIKPESMEKVKTELGKSEAKRFIEEIHNPVYYYHPGKVSVAAFTSVSATMNRKEWEQKVKSTVDRMAKMSKFIPLLKTDQKMAVVLMVEGKP